jgi:hypothetical protein
MDMPRLKGTQAKEYIEAGAGDGTVTISLTMNVSQGKKPLIN